MKILAIEIEKPSVRSEQFQPHLKFEARRVWDLYLAGIVREAYFDSEQHAAVLILECTSKKEAKGILATLPLVEAGLIDFTPFPLIPYNGFARLFDELNNTE